MPYITNFHALLANADEVRNGQDPWYVLRRVMLFGSAELALARMAEPMGYPACFSVEIYDSPPPDYLRAARMTRIDNGEGGIRYAWDGGCPVRLCANGLNDRLGGKPDIIWVVAVPCESPPDDEPSGNA